MRRARARSRSRGDAAARRRLPEQRRVSLRHRPRSLPVAGPQPSRQLALAAAGQRDQPLRVLRQQRLGEPRDGLRPREVRPRHQPAQAPPARRVPGEQHEVRPALRLADPPVVLLHDRPMAGQPGAGRAGPGGPPSVDRPAARRRPVAGGRAARRRLAGTTIPPGSGAAASTSSISIPITGMQPRRLRRGREADRAVQALVVRDGEPGQPELHGPRDEVVRGRGPVEEREVAVTVQLGVGGMGHATGLRGAGRRIEQMFDIVSRPRTPEWHRFRCPRTQPDTGSARLMPVIADPTRHPGRRLALELLVRAAAIAAATTVILGLLPAIARAVG